MDTDATERRKRGLRRIGALAAELGLTPRTLRYYEELGLLAPASRTGRGARFYDEAAYTRLRTIQRLQAAGLSLETIREELDLRAELAELGDRPASVEQLERVVADLSARHEGARARVRELEDALTQARQREGQLRHDAEIAAAALARRRADVDAN